MTTLRTAAQQALEVMSDISSFERWSEVRDALKAAMQEPVQEPVAWRWRMRNLTDAPGFVQPWTVTTYYPREQANEIEPLYTSPPQRKPLTEEEIGIICASLGFAQISPVEVARAIERAHGIGGKDD